MCCCCWNSDVFVPPTITAPGLRTTLFPAIAGTQTCSIFEYYKYTLQNLNLPVSAVGWLASKGVLPT